MPPLSEPICQALNLSDGKRCTKAAVVWDDLFCRFHGKQCHGLYAGYKKRNAQLDGLAEQTPEYLKSNETPLANETFEHVQDESVLNQINAHLFSEYVLLGKVIDARKLHHKHFFPLKLDYGHQAYLDTLSNRRHIVLRALEKVVKRTAEVLYAKEEWYKWIGEVQHREETNREKEAKKVKLESAMFKRHWKKMQTRIRTQREKEEKQRQEAFLESVYQQRINAATESEQDIEMWDPIEDFLEDERCKYVDLIKHFLWMEVLNEEEEEDEENQSTSATATGLTTGVKSLSVSKPAPTKKPKKSKQKDSKTLSVANKLPESRSAFIKQSQSERAGQTRILAMMDSEETGGGAGDNNTEPDKSNIETEEAMRKRLKEGVEKNYDDVYGPILVGSLETPHGTHDKTPPLDDDEIETLIQDVKEIKRLLFCRLLLSHASLLPAALRATSVDEFLNDTKITEADLRDMCLKVEQPSLQDIRDACADLLREDEPETEKIKDDEHEDLSFEDIILQDRRYGRLQGPIWFYENMIAQRSKVLGEPVTSLRELLKPAPKQTEKTKVQICGKSIWNYSSESSMSREGWLQFSVLAKGCDLRKAVQLCRNWDEFSQLNFLASWQYFPASNWVSWGTDRLTKQLHDLGFFPFFIDLGAENFSRHFQAGGSRSQQRRRHDFVEARNIVVGHMKRNDSATRRFLQYCSMRTGEVLLAVRDGRTGKIITAPRSKDALWTLRSKRGIGRAAKKEWDVELEIGPEYFEFVEQYRNWHLGFDDYYEVWIWHFVPGQSGVLLYNSIVEELRRAWRIVKPIDMYNRQEPFLRTLTRNNKTKRVRLIKHGEQVKSLWDEVQDPDNIFFLTDVTNKTTRAVRGDGTLDASPHTFYNEADAAEDAILFPDELISLNRDVPFKEVSNAITRLEDGSGTMSRYLAKLAMESSHRSKKPPQLLDEYSDTDESWKSGDSVYDFNDAFSDETPEKGFKDEDGDVTKHWHLPQLWEDQTNRINEGHIDATKKKILSNVGLLELLTGNIRKGPSDTEFAKNLKTLDRMMLLEKDRGDALLKAFHAGDLEPDAPKKYEETCAIVSGILNQQGTDSNHAWLWFTLEVLEWLEVRADYTDYTQVMTAPWPHPFITQDILKAWAYMAIFFPDLEQCQPATDFFKSKEGQRYQQSSLRDPSQRASTLPDIRTKTSFRYRPKSFWREWDDIVTKAKTTRTYYADAYPLQWSVAVRPILAKLYLAGIIAPTLLQNSPQICPGFAVANTESHRPDKMDLFIDYADRLKASSFPTSWPGFVRPDEYPVFLPLARDFAAKNQRASFAVLRLWSAPHFYPAMLGDNNRMGSAFLDCAARSWQWNFIPKDMPVSEWSMYNNLKLRLDLVKKQLGDRVVHRGDVVLVMGVDQLDLLRYATAVTFAIQTKPWFREFDLWKSFINVDIGFLEKLDPYWLD
ncbi:hypothetical protein F4801DRAFT_564907 [Xylaria longipes]|nr:hypothetical protein F4801DRAFT_564907 [Xylaria longipes]